MEIRLLNRSNIQQIQICQKIAEQNYLDNLVLMGDLYPPCIDLTKIFGLFTEDSELQSFFVIFEGFNLPSVVLPVKLEQDYYVKIMEYLQDELPQKFFFLSLELQENDVQEYFTVNWVSTDYCMKRNSKPELKEYHYPNLTKARNSQINRIDAFYKEIDVSPWNPKQFESGFYHFIEKDDQIIACGGTHFETPRLAQLGNIFVLKDHRGQHFGEILTTAITQDVLAQKEIATLFVHQDNTPALHLYKKLGFQIYKKANLIFSEKK